MTAQQAINLLRATKKASKAGTLENVEEVRNSLKTSLSELSLGQFGELLSTLGVMKSVPSSRKLAIIDQLVKWATFGK